MNLLISFLFSFSFFFSIITGPKTPAGCELKGTWKGTCVEEDESSKMVLKLNKEGKNYSGIITINDGEDIDTLLVPAVTLENKISFYGVDGKDSTMFEGEMPNCSSIVNLKMEDGGTCKLSK